MKKLKTVLTTGLIVIAAIVGIIFGGGLFFWQGMYVSEDSVVEAIEKQGYTDVVVDDKDIFFVSSFGGECGEKDDALFEVTATNALGKRVELIACAGWPWKGVTIRTE